MQRPTTEVISQTTYTFGRVPKKTISPLTTAGECERLVLTPALSNEVTDDVGSSKALLESHKALILVPSYTRAEQWSPVATPPPKDKVSERIRAFRLAEATLRDKLLLAARYDGVDLPGDTCRVMVIDDLPMGSGPLERFQWEYLNLSDKLRSTVASRIVQSFGRISRGMSDHGVVLITGQALIGWLHLPANLGLLPGFLQSQIRLGHEVSGNLTSTEEFGDVIDKCLTRDNAWTTAYNDWMQDAAPDSCKEHSQEAVDVALGEARFIEAMWDRDFERAAKSIKRGAKAG